MPIKSCREANKPGFRWGSTNKCWTYTPGNEESKKAAKKKCINQAIKIEGPAKFSKIMKNESKGELTQGIISELIFDNDTPVELLGTLLEQYQPANFLDKVYAAEYVNSKKNKRKLIMIG